MRPVLRLEQRAGLKLVATAWTPPNCCWASTAAAAQTRAALGDPPRRKVAGRALGGGAVCINSALIETQFLQGAMAHHLGGDIIRLPMIDFGCTSPGPAAPAGADLGADQQVPIRQRCDRAGLLCLRRFTSTHFGCTQQ